jgi:hypothetical protein
MSEETGQFDDQDLKVAVRQLRGDHKVRPELRDRVVRSLAEARLQGGGGPTAEPRPASQPPPSPGRPSGLSRCCLAVGGLLLLMAIGGLLGYRWYQRAQENHADQSRGTALLGAMVAIHDIGRGTTSGLQPLSAPLGDPRALAAEAARKLGRPIPVVDLSARGWSLDAADFCTIGTARAVRFHFTRVNQSVSVLSTASAEYTKADAGHYELTIGEHPIAGYVRNGILTCVVGDAACGQGDTVALRDAIRGQ